jgi:hypothetical protein
MFVSTIIRMIAPICLLCPVVYCFGFSPLPGSWLGLKNVVVSAKTVSQIGYIRKKVRTSSILSLLCVVSIRTSHSGSNL